MNRIDVDSLRALVEQRIPDADVDVRLFSGDDHFEMRVVSPAFAGKPRIARHKMIYDILTPYLSGAIHALSLKTWTPEQWRDKNSPETI
jgi:stress-induced morphogen